MCLSELVAIEGLSKGPTWGCNIVRHQVASIAGGNLKREALSIEVGVALPVLTPVSGHSLPICS